MKEPFVDVADALLQIGKFIFDDREVRPDQIASALGTHLFSVIGYMLRDNAEEDCPAILDGFCKTFREHVMIVRARHISEKSP